VTPQIPTVYEPGNDVSLPTVIREVKPTYTLEAAAQARVQFASFGLALIPVTSGGHRSSNRHYTGPTLAACA
jgi:hypothetical protein